MSSRVELTPGQVWLGKGKRPCRRIVSVTPIGPAGARVVGYSTGGDWVSFCTRATFLRWRQRRYDERHGQKGALV